jgi:hypothetical protein
MYSVGRLVLDRPFEFAAVVMVVVVPATHYLLAMSLARQPLSFQGPAPSGPAPPQRPSAPAIHIK